MKDFERVRVGELLVEIVDDDYRAQVESARANVAAAQAAIHNFEEQKLLQATLVEQAEASIRASEADVTRYRLETTRQQTLLATGLAGTRQLVEQAVDNEKRADATLSLNRAKLSQQKQQLGVLDSQKAQAIATLNSQRALLDLAEINLGYTRIFAPASGMVSRRQVQPGQYVSAGTQVFTLAPLPNIWVLANFKETQMTNVRIGQDVDVKVDAFPGSTLRGRVDSWSPASGADFALLPPDNATGNFTKVVQRIPVKIVINSDPKLRDLLRPGMSVVATIDTNSRPGISISDER